MRLSRRDDELVVSIEFSQHDDEFANGGYLVWLWVLQLVARPERDRVLIGHHATDRDDVSWRSIIADASGIDEGRGENLRWDDVERGWTEIVADPSWSSWER